MNEKTEELRDIFMDVTDEESVTEQQKEGPGLLADDRNETERLGEVVAEMRDRYEFTTSLSDEELVRIIEGFYHGESDSEIADDLDVSRRTVFRARLDLQLLRERDTDAPFDMAEFRDMLVDDASTGELADALDVSESTVRRYRRVIWAQNQARRASDRFRSEFEDILVDAELADQLTIDMKDDGLDEATEGVETETNTSF